MTRSKQQIDSGIAQREARLRKEFTDSKYALWKYSSRRATLPQSALLKSKGANTNEAG